MTSSTKMRTRARHTGVAALGGTLVACTGCGRAPAFNVLGSYFPGWIACLALGAVGAAVLCWLLRRTNLEGQVPWLPLFYLSAGTAIACAFWLLLFQ